MREGRAARLQESSSRHTGDVTTHSLTKTHMGLIELQNGTSENDLELEETKYLKLSETALNLDI